MNQRSAISLGPGASSLILIFVVLRGDLIGFDSYVPAADKVSSCAILDEDYDYNMWVGRGSIGDGYALNHMYITDVDSFVNLASIGMKEKKNYSLDSYFSDGYDVSILYRMKDGRKIYRSIFIPYDIDEALMDNIISSEEYKKGHYVCFDDEQVRKVADQEGVTRSVTYVSACGSKSDDTLTLSEISDAYRLDILENANYPYLRVNQPVGNLELYSNGYYYVNVTIPVYENYANLMKLLKNHDLYVDSKLTADMVSSITVDNYYPGVDIDNLGDGGLNSYDGMATTSANYTSDKNRQQIEDILEGVVSSDYNGNWYDYSLKDHKYSVDITLKNDTDNYRGNVRYYAFLKGKVPEFVVKDTE